MPARRCKSRLSCPAQAGHPVFAVIVVKLGIGGYWIVRIRGRRQWGQASMTPVLRLFEDVLSSDAAVNLPALPRMMFVAHGFVAIGDRTLHDGEATGSEGTVALKAGSGGATLWRWEMVAQEGGGVIAGAGVSSREKLTARLDSSAEGQSASPRRQRRVSAGRLRLSASPSGAGHPLSARRRHPHRHARPLDLVRSRWRLVRKRPRPGIRAGRRPADAFHPHHDPAGRVSGQKLRRISQRRRQGEAEGAAVQDFRRSAAGGVTLVARMSVATCGVQSRGRSRMSLRSSGLQRKRITSACSRAPCRHRSAWRCRP